MALESHLLTDLETGQWQETFALTSQNGPQLAGSTNWSINKHTLRGGVSDGIDVVAVDNGVLTFELLPTRGMGLWRGEIAGHPLGWSSPAVYPVHPAHVRIHERSGLGWLDGFNEWMCRCGISSMGAPGLDVKTLPDGTTVETELSLHGRIANTPAHRVSIEIEDDGAGTISVTGVMDEACLFGPRLRLTSTTRTAAGAASLQIVDEVINLSNQPAEFEILYHTNVGRPWLDEGAKLLAAAPQIAAATADAGAAIERWSNYGAPTPGFAEHCYFFHPRAGDDGQAEVLLRNARGDLGLAVRFPTDQLPCFTVWKRTAGEGDGYVTGLEPGTAYPNLRSFERDQGRVITLQPGESYRTSVEIAPRLGVEAVSEVQGRIKAMQGDSSPELIDTPQPPYTPAK